MSGNDDHVYEKGFAQSDGSHQQFDHSMDSATALRNLRAAGSVSMSPELFEKLYLSPPSQVKGDLRKTFGNPTPLGLCGFLLALTPLSWTLMGWRGAGGGGAANIGWYYFAGGLLMLLGGLGEWVLGNTFSFVVFCSFGSFWAGYAATLQPSLNAFAAYKDTNDPSSTGLESVGFNVGLAYYMLCMTLLCIVFLICSIRTNVVYFLIFLTLGGYFVLLAGAFFQVANGNLQVAAKCQEASGAFAFTSCLLGWYIFLAIMLLSVDFPIELPLGDLSHVVRGASEKRKVDQV